MKMIQIRNVPEALHRRLKVRAATEGLSLSDYLQTQMQAVADRPTVAELTQRLESRSRASLSETPTEALRRERSARGPCRPSADPLPPWSPP